MNNDEGKKEVGFKAMPDAEKNRLILWANDDEFAEVNDMLEQMGASGSSEGRDRSKVRVIEGGNQEDVERLLKQIESAYPGKLNITRPPAKAPVEPPQPKTAEPDNVTQNPSANKSRFMTVQLQSDTQKQPAPKPDSESDPAAVNVVVTEDGRLVLTSDDPTALNHLEDLLQEVAPAQQEFVKFKLRYVLASSVVDKLEEYFSEELKDQTESVFDNWGEKTGEKAKDVGPITLGKRQALRFISENYTNTVIVQGAGASQLAAIRDLIAVYDRKPEPKFYYARKTEVISLKYSRAENIAESLKDVYRELLSSKDKEFRDGDGRQQVVGNRESTYVFGESGVDAEGEENHVLIKFDGILSIGVDHISNALIVSGREEVLESVVDTVKLLDLAAKPDTEIRVHRVGGTLPAEELQKMLKGSLSDSWPGGKPYDASARGNGGGNNGRARQRNNGGNNNRRGRGRR